ncbi:MAG TPA: gamma-glutamylcyclotransferase family protein [Alphaproteobacteria bacterium]|nr:gamma-glutamylcyclotransferase family protein [Alphaproteobacteria bacterium]
MLVFAYGSNMDWDQMRTRCPSARFLCVALLPDHALVFPRHSNNRNCGVSSVEPRAGRCVWGAVFEIDERDVPALDRSEGYVPGRPPERNAYIRRPIQVLDRGDATAPRTLEIYVANRQEGRFLPSKAYKALIVSGAAKWDLPPDYRAELERIETLD